MQNHDLDFLRIKTNEAFAAMLLYRDFYASAMPFQGQFQQTVKHLRERALAMKGRDMRASLFFERLADAFEEWNSGKIRTRSTSGE